MIERITSKLTKTIELKGGKVVKTVMQDVKNDLVRSPVVERLEVSSADTTKQAIKAERMRFIDDLYKKLDVDALEKQVNMDDSVENFYYKLAIQQKMTKDTGVNLLCDSAHECVGILKQASKILTEQLNLYKKLGMSLPDEIQIKDLGYDGGGETSCAHTVPDLFDEKNPITTIILDKNIFKEEFKREHKTVLDNVLEIFNHEQTHSRHAKENTRAFIKLLRNGLNVILTKDEQITMFELKYIYYKHYKELNKNGFFHDVNSLETHLAHDNNNTLHQAGTYNMTYIGNHIKMLDRYLNYDRKTPEAKRILSKELHEDFSPEFLKKLEPIQKKFETITYTICEEDLRAYAFCNPLETVAVAADKEYAGEALSDDMRNLLKEFGAPETKHMSYWPEDRPANFKPKTSKKD